MACTDAVARRRATGTASLRWVPDEERRLDHLQTDTAARYGWAVRAVLALSAACSCATSAPAQQDKPDRWPAPFGGRWNAQFTIASDYSYAGISNTELKPAFQVGLDYSSPFLLPLGPPLWLYVTGFGSNVQFPGLPPGVEID